MDLIKLTGEGIKIKTKKGSFIVDSLSNPEKDVVMYTNSKVDSPLLETEPIVLNGEGEYEIADVLIKAENIGDSVFYTITEDNQSVLLFPSSIAKQIKDTENYDAVVIKVENRLDESFFSPFSSITPIVFADGEFLDQIQSKKKLPKINLSKREEIEESIIQLAK